MAIQNNNNIEKLLEAILFVMGEPASFERLAKILECPKSEVKSAAEALEENLNNRGLRLMMKDESLLLATAPECTKVIADFKKEEVSGELTKASLEALSIVVYKGPITRPEIDYIRGVNSTFILRNLMVRGLIERTPNPKDARSYLYKPSFDLMQHLGVAKMEELPEYEEFREGLDKFIKEGEKDKDKNEE